MWGFLLVYKFFTCANVTNEYLMAQNTLRGRVMVNDGEYKSLILNNHLHNFALHRIELPSCQI